MYLLLVDLGCVVSFSPWVSYLSTFVIYLPVFKSVRAIVVRLMSFDSLRLCLFYILFLSQPIDFCYFFFHW